jgi:hypothetical protein
MIALLKTLLKPDADFKLHKNGSAGLELLHIQIEG